MSSEVLTILFLGVTLIILATGFVLALLASLGFHTYLKAQDNKKKIEVHAENSNRN